MAKCLKKIGCKVCGSSKSVQPFLNDDGTLSAFCFGLCQKVVKDPYGDNPPDLSNIEIKTKEEIEEEIQEIKSCPNVGTYRGIKPAYWKKYGVRASVNQVTGQGAYAIHHPHTRDGILVSYMSKAVRKKKMWCVGNINTADLYGWEIARRSGARTLYITEGQEDCLAVDMILTEGDGEKYKQKNAVTSLPNGVKSVACLGRQADEIRRLFEDVVLVFDDDKTGRQAVKDAMVHIPKARVVYLPAKDANECIQQDLMSEAYKVLKFRKADAPIAGVVKFKDVKNELYKVSALGLTLPWAEVNDRVRGLHVGLYTLAGGEGLGKTSLVHQMIAKLCEDGIGVLAYMGEETKEETYQNVGSKILGRDVTKPDQPLTEEESSSLDKPLDNLYVYDVDEDRSSSAQGLMTNILDTFRSLLDYTDILFVDNLTKMTESIPTAGEKNEFISMFAAEMDTFARRTGKTIVVLSHFNKQNKTETPYSEGGRGNSNQLAGGAGLARYSLGIFYVERNSQGIDPSCIKFRIGKNRKGKWTGVVKQYYQIDTTRVIEAQWEDGDFKTAK